MDNTQSENVTITCTSRLSRSIIESSKKLMIWFGVYSNAYRTTSEELRAKERQYLSEGPDSPNNYNAIRRAAEVHRQVRGYARKNIKPGMTMTEIVEMIENGTRALVEENGMKSGIGFPTGVNRNHCAAHFSPNAGDKTGMLSISSLLSSLMTGECR